MDRASSAHRPNGRIFKAQISQNQHEPTFFPQVRIPPDFMPDGKKSLAAIGRHAFGLGIALGISTMTTVQLAIVGNDLWRLGFFLMALCLFHYLEFTMTARYNPPDAKVSSFLLFSNGCAYNIAHTTAIFEILLRYWLSSRNTRLSGLLPTSMQDLSNQMPLSMTTVLGISLVVIGQVFRSLAMKQAGTSFNHVVQSNKKEDHVLVTTGVYAISRHPAYFGFFWWGIGTQLVLGNPFCFLAYAAVLWNFFAHRIRREEKHLLVFFGEAYEHYRERVPVLIPLIR